MTSNANDDEAVDDNADLRALVADLGQRSVERLTGVRSRPVSADTVLWDSLEETGLARLSTTTEFEAGPAQVAILLGGLARSAAPVPVAETDLLGAWLAGACGQSVPDSGSLTLGFGTVIESGERLNVDVGDVPWLVGAAAVLIVAEVDGRPAVAVVDPGHLGTTETQSLTGELRHRFEVVLPRSQWKSLPDRAFDELRRRGAWARCVQVLGSLETAFDLTVTHTRDRKQFGRSLVAFQSVQHELSRLLGSLEKARAAVDLAIAAADDLGFGADQTDYAVAVAKVTLDHCVEEIVTGSHQLHGAIGVTAEHQLWLHTMRARSAVAEFGSPRQWAQHLGGRLIAADDPWDVLIGSVGPSDSEAITAPVTRRGCPALDRAP